MTRTRSRQHGGATFLEFTLVGIPMIFALISIFEMARGMWLYHTLAYSVREGTRYTTVHGSDCATSPNSCTVTIGQIAGVIQNAGTGLDPSLLNLTFTPSTGSSIRCALADCLNNGTTWPPSNANTPGMTVAISGIYPFRSAIAMFWPGSNPSGPFPAVNFPAASQDTIQF
jgi:Flp pilus assembly protein TadG